MLTSSHASVVSTGSLDLDVLLDGGFCAGQVYLIESRVPEIARQVAAWFWARHVFVEQHVCGLVFTEGGTDFGRALAAHAANLTIDSRAFRATTQGHPVANVRSGWEVAHRDMARAEACADMALIVADGVPTYRGSKTYEETRDVSLRGLALIARHFEVPVIAFDQDPPKVPDHVRAHSLEAIAGNGRVTMRRRGRTGAGIPLDLPAGTVRQLAPRKKPDFVTVEDLVPGILREPA